MIEFLQTWLVTFGAQWKEGEGWQPQFLAAKELNSQQCIKLDKAALIARLAPPYLASGTSLVICFVGEALVGCHIRLGWPLPARLIDLKVEFRNLANGEDKPCGADLIGAMVWFGLPVCGISIRAANTGDGEREIQALEHLFSALKPALDNRAVHRGRYLISVGRIEAAGIPANVTMLNAFEQHWRNLTRMIGPVIADARPSSIAVGPDGRHRTPLRPFASRTGRNQPSSNHLMVGPGWLRRLIKPHAGMCLALIDWSAQEFGIAAALSGDQRMMADYCTGDPYQSLAERYGGDRTVFKACALGVLNGIGVSGLARNADCDAGKARHLLREHRAEYPFFWQWSDNIENEAFLHGKLRSTFGWQVAVKPESNPRFLRNFPLQANGAEMLRLACCFATERGVTVCAPNHDALLIEAPLEEIADAITVTGAAMAKASEIVLDGFTLRTSVTIIRHPEHYPHPKSDDLWSDIDRCLTDLDESTAPVHERDASCAQPNPRPISLYVFNRKDQSDGLD